LILLDASLKVDLTKMCLSVLWSIIVLIVIGFSTVDLLSIGWLLMLNLFALILVKK